MRCLFGGARGEPWAPTKPRISPPRARNGLSACSAGPHGAPSTSRRRSAANATSVHWGQGGPHRNMTCPKTVFFICGLDGDWFESHVEPSHARRGGRPDRVCAIGRRWTHERRRSGPRHRLARPPATPSEAAVANLGGGGLVSRREGKEVRGLYKSRKHW